MITTLNDGQWKGSMQTAESVAEQILEKYGEEAMNEYDPLTNCLTFKTWLSRGFVVKKGEHGLKSITYIKKVEKDEKTGEVVTIQSYPKTVTLFWKDQVKPL